MSESSQEKESQVVYLRKCSAKDEMIQIHEKRPKSNFKNYHQDTIGFLAEPGGMISQSMLTHMLENKMLGFISD